jgi:hypothetical protein
MPRIALQPAIVAIVVTTVTSNGVDFLRGDILEPVDKCHPRARPNDSDAVCACNADASLQDAIDGLLDGQPALPLNPSCEVPAVEELNDHVVGATVFERPHVEDPRATATAMPPTPSSRSTGYLPTPVSCDHADASDPRPSRCPPQAMNASAPRYAASTHRTRTPPCGSIKPIEHRNPLAATASSIARLD